MDVSPFFRAPHRKLAASLFFAPLFFAPVTQRRNKMDRRVSEPVDRSRPGDGLAPPGPGMEFRLRLLQSETSLAPTDEHRDKAGHACPPHRMMSDQPGDIGIR